MKAFDHCMLFMEPVQQQSVRQGVMPSPVGLDQMIRSCADPEGQA